MMTDLSRNESIVPETPNKNAPMTLTTPNPMNYSLTDSVRTDGYDIMVNTDFMLKYLQLDKSDFRLLREGKFFHFTKNRFPEPIKIKGRNFWSLAEVRLWELEEVEYRRSCDHNRIDEACEIYQGIRDAINTSLDNFKYKLSDSIILTFK